MLDTFKHYNYLEILEILSKLKLHWKNSVKPCKLNYCNVWLVVAFGRFIAKKISAKISFLLKLHSVISKNIKCTYT